MNATMKTISAAAGLLMLGAAFAPSTAGAAEGMAPPAVDWSFSGVFGSFDRAQLQRGYEVYRNVCSGCHSLNQIYFRNLVDIGLSEARIKEIAAGVQVPGEPDDSGDPTTRPAKLFDKLPAPFPNEKAARAANNGALPPDLSLMIKARKGGADYVHAILTGFKDAPAGFKLNEGMNYNEYFPGNQIAMPPPLSDGAVEYADGTKATVDQMSRDVSAFLAWTSEPEMESRKRLGIKVMLFLLVLTGLLYALKRSIWSDLH